MARLRDLGCRAALVVGLPACVGGGARTEPDDPEPSPLDARLPAVDALPSPAGNRDSGPADFGVAPPDAGPAPPADLGPDAASDLSPDLPPAPPDFGPDAAPEPPDAALGPPRESVGALVERRFLALATVDAAAPSRPAAPPERYPAVYGGPDDEPHRQRSLTHGILAHRLPDASVVVVEPDECGAAMVARRLSGGRARSLGRFATVTCAVADARELSISPGAGWVADEWRALRLDGSETSVDLATDCGEGRQPWARFAAWDGPDAAVAQGQACLFRLELPGGAATRLSTPEPGCAVVVDAGRVAVRSGERLLLDCPAGLTLVNPAGDAELVARNLHASAELPAVVAPWGPVVLATGGFGPSAVVAFPDGESEVRPLPPETDSALLVPDGDGAAVLLASRPAGARSEVGIALVGARSTSELARTTVPGGLLDSAVAGRLPHGPVLFTLRRDGAVGAVHVVAELAGERSLTVSVATPEPDCRLRPWVGETTKAVLECDASWVVDAAGALGPTFSRLGHPLAFVSEPGRLSLLAYEAETFVAVADAAGEVTVGEASSGEGRWLGVAGGEVVVARAAPALDFGAVGAVTWRGLDDTAPRGDQALAGTALGLAGGWVVAWDVAGLSAVNADGRRASAAVEGLSPSNPPFTVAGAGARVFTQSDDGALAVHDFGAAPPVTSRLLAEGLPWVSRHPESTVFDRGSRALVFAASDGVRVLRLGAEGQADAARPRLPVADARLVPDPAGGRVVAYGADGVWSLCTRSRGCPPPERLADAFGAPLSFTPDGRFLVSGDGVLFDLARPGSRPETMPCRDGPCPVDRWSAGIGFEFSPDGRLMRHRPFAAFLLSEARGLDLTGPFAGAAPIAQGSDGLTLLTEAGATAIFVRDERLVVRRADAELRPLEDLPGPEWAWGPSLSGRALTRRGPLAVWRTDLGAEQPESRVYTAGDRPGTPVALRLTVDGAVIATW